MTTPSLLPCQPTPSQILTITPHAWRCAIPTCLTTNPLFPSPLDPPTGCSHPKTPICPLLNAHGTPIKLTGGLNQLPDRLVPIGWSYCIASILQRPPSSLALWERSAVTNHVSGPCRGCFVVNCYGERLVRVHTEAYLGVDGKLVGDLEVLKWVIPQGPLLEHWGHFAKLKMGGEDGVVVGDEKGVVVKWTGGRVEGVVKPEDALAECVLFGVELLAGIAGI